MDLCYASAVHAPVRSASIAWARCRPASLRPALCFPCTCSLACQLFTPCPQGVRPSFVASCLNQQAPQQPAQQQAAQQPAADSMGREGNRRLSLPATERAPPPSPPPPSSLSAPRRSAPAAVAGVPASAAGTAGAAGVAGTADASGAADAAVAEPPAQQPTVQGLQRQLLEAQQQLAAMAALQASTAAAAAVAAAAGQPSQDVLNGRSASGSVESGTPERLSGDAPVPAAAAPCSPAGCCQPAVSPPLSVEAVRSSD